MRKTIRQFAVLLSLTVLLSACAGGTHSTSEAEQSANETAQSAGSAIDAGQNANDSAPSDSASQAGGVPDGAPDNLPQDGAPPDGAPGGTPPDGGSGGPGGTPPGGSSDGTVLTYTAAVEITAADTQSGQSYASTTADESALLVSTADAVGIADPIVTKSGDSDGGDNCNFYGLNAAVLVKGGSTTTITGGTITSDAAGANGVFSYGGNGGQNGATGDGTTVIISDTAITTTGSGSGGIMTTGGGITEPPAASRPPRSAPTAAAEQLRWTEEPILLTGLVLPPSIPRRTSPSKMPRWFPTFPKASASKGRIPLP